MKFLHYIIVALLLIASATHASAAKRPRKNHQLHRTDSAFFCSPEARRIGDQLLMYQRVTGGWPKNIDMCRELSDAEAAEVMAQKTRRYDSTTDNGATIMQLPFLARLYRYTGDTKYRDGVKAGISFLLSGQYPGGGWPQFWPENRGYQKHITYNDGAMAGTMAILRDLMYGVSPFENPELLPEGGRPRLMNAFYRGIECMLATQIRDRDGNLTIWCQQHDSLTLAPAKARAYELPSYTPSETVGILGILMSVPEPDSRIRNAIHSAMQWIDDHKITGYRYKRTFADGWSDVSLVRDSTAAPIWARFYDLEHAEPYVCDRDGIPRRRLDMIGHERRNGYGWYSDGPAVLYQMYDAWADRWDPAGKLPLRLDTPGANETGRMRLEVEYSPDPADFDAVVMPGQSIQQAISRAPAGGTKPYTILIKKGDYNEKVIIDRPNIVLVGEHRDSTRLILAERNSNPLVKEYNGRPAGAGVIMIQEGADDCIISGLTVYNNYGTTVEPTTTHQMAIFGRATRTIIINCNVWADGNDALSLWSREPGMYYHADLDLRCRGVDFLCPRGWCYATRCRFMGDGHALIWHDGRKDPSMKLVITDSDFDSQTPAPLGRWHHNSQFYLRNCHLSERILDQDIAYAYTDKVLDPCDWGKRVYYLDCTRVGGHSGWLDDNFDQAPGRPQYHEVTAQWTFDGKWDPEARIRSLWPILRY